MFTLLHYYRIQSWLGGIAAPCNAWGHEFNPTPLQPSYISFHSHIGLGSKGKEGCRKQAFGPNFENSIPDFGRCDIKIGENLQNIDKSVGWGLCQLPPIHDILAIYILNLGNNLQMLCGGWIWTISISILTVKNL